MLRQIKNNHRKFITEFILLYKSFPTLWNVKSSEYNDRDAKRSAYSDLINKLREVEPDANKQDVIRKINSLRSAFRREHRKVVLMEKSVGKIYRPRLWYYNIISFTAENEKSSKKNSMENEERNREIDIISLENPHNIHENSFKEEEDDMFVEEFNSNGSLNSKPHISCSSQIRPLPKGHDEYDAVGYNVASKLRNMDRNQRILAERIIAETLFQGQMGALSINSACSNFYPTISAQERDVEDVKFTPITLL